MQLKQQGLANVLMDTFSSFCQVVLSSGAHINLSSQRKAGIVSFKKRALVNVLKDTFSIFCQALLFGSSGECAARDDGSRISVIPLRRLVSPRGVLYPRRAIPPGRRQTSGAHWAGRD